MSTTAQVIEQIGQTIGAEHLLLGQDVHSRSAGIWRSDTITADAIVRPKTVDQISQVLKICHEAGQPVVAHGGLTGLVQSAITKPGEIVLSLEHLNQIEEIDPVNRTMTVQSGVILQQLQEAAEQEDLMFPLDLGARGSCTIGGNISTNAGGNRVIRYGMTRDMVLGLEAVLADGTVISSMNHMIKNNAGYDLKQLFMGTEGTLGVVTRAVLRLREQPSRRATGFAALASFTEVSKFLRLLDSELGGALSAFEVMWHNYYNLVTTAPANNKPPFNENYPYYVLFEAMGVDDNLIEAALGQALESDVVADVVIAQNEAQRGQLWSIRDDVEQVFRDGPAFLFDVSLRIHQMEDYVAEVNRRLESAFETYHNYVLGHVGDGNLHFCIGAGADSAEVHQQIEACVYEPLAAIHGSVSAEHGIGLEKKPYLSISRTAEEIQLMQTLKNALDPKGILNPGKVI